jgi:serine protease Do
MGDYGYASNTPMTQSNRIKKRRTGRKRAFKKKVICVIIGLIVGLVLGLFIGASITSSVGAPARSSNTSTANSVTSNNGSEITANNSDSTYSSEKEAEVTQKKSTVKLADESDTGQALSSIVNAIRDCIVEIKTETTYGLNYHSETVTNAGAGSGVVYRQNGYIVTNHHVIDGVDAIKVLLTNGDEYKAKLIGGNKSKDLALLKIEASELTVAKCGDSSQLKYGDTAIVIGNPLGELGGTVTVGVISALDRALTIDGQTMTLLQTDASVNPGNSGGGLFNISGELVGIVNAKSMGPDVEGIGFAIPINTAIESIKEFAGELPGEDEESEKDETEPQVGVTIKYFSLADARAEGYDMGRGVYVTESYISKLEEGDLIISIDGADVGSVDGFTYIVNEREVGDKVNIVIKRDGKETNVTVTLIAKE